MLIRSVQLQVFPSGIKPTGLGDHLVWLITQNKMDSLCIFQWCIAEELSSMQEFSPTRTNNFPPSCTETLPISSRSALIRPQLQNRIQLNVLVSPEEVECVAVSRGSDILLRLALEAFEFPLWFFRFSVECNTTRTVSCRLPLTKHTWDDDHLKELKVFRLVPL